MRCRDLLRAEAVGKSGKSVIPWSAGGWADHERAISLVSRQAVLAINERARPRQPRLGDFLQVNPIVRGAPSGAIPWSPKRSLRLPRREPEAIARIVRPLRCDSGASLDHFSYEKVPAVGSCHAST